MPCRLPTVARSLSLIALLAACGASVLLAGCPPSQPTTLPEPVLDKRASYDTIVSAASAPVASTRVQAVELLASHHPDKACPVLVGALKDADAGVRAAAAKGMSRSCPRPVAKALTALLEDPDATVRVEAAMSLGRLGDAAALTVLAEALTAETDLGRTLSLLAALGGTRSSKAASPLLARVADRAPLVRSAALSALARLRPVPSFDPRLAERAKDPKVHVRTDLAALLGLMKGQTPAARLLEKLLLDGDENVRHSAAAALQVLADPSTTVALRRAAATDSSARVRGAAKVAVEGMPSGEGGEGGEPKKER